MAMVNAFVVVRAAASVTRNVTLAETAAVGVPVMAPVVALSERPAGSAPAEIDHVYGAAPPVAERLAL